MLLFCLRSAERPPVASSLMSDDTLSASESFCFRAIEARLRRSMYVGCGVPDHARAQIRKKTSLACEVRNSCRSAPWPCCVRERDRRRRRRRAGKAGGQPLCGQPGDVSSGVRRSIGSGSFETSGLLFESIASSDGSGEAMPSNVSAHPFIVNRDLILVTVLRGSVPASRTQIAVLRLRGCDRSHRQGLLDALSI